MISEAPTGSQVHTVVGIDFAAVSRFNVGVEVQILRGVEVGAEAVFIPSAAKILREAPAMALERIGVARLSLPIVKDGRPDVYVAFVFRKFKAGHEARTTDERFSRILFHAVVGGRRVIDAFNPTVHEFDLRLDEEGVDGMETVPCFNGEGEHIGVIVSLDVARIGRDVELVVDSADLQRTVEECPIVE